MEIIKATWENRNLGTDAYEFKLSNEDLNDIPNVIKQISSNQYDNAYLTIKMPAGDLNALHSIEDAGFRFMETQLHMTKSLIDYETPKLISRLKNSLEKKEVEKNEKDWESVANLLRDDTFHTDRIYLDPKLKKGTSRKRYHNWMMDLVNEPTAHLFLYYYKNEPVGFGLVLINNNTNSVTIILEGIFENYQKSGFGKIMLDIALKSYQDQGITKVEKNVSGNNIAIMNLDMLFGYLIVKQEYVLRKYNKKNTPTYLHGK